MAAREHTEPPIDAHGLLLVDKPSGITSHDVVDEVRRLFRTKRVGHAGTLDPLADGLLVVLVGEATKLAEYLQSSDKQYEGTLQLGFTSDTFDSTGVVASTGAARLPKLDDLCDLADEMTGAVDQVPPPFSAKKVAGKKLYEYARSGKSVEVEPRKIRVKDFQLFENDTAKDLVDFAVECSAGTYVRALVHDLGKKAGCGAILTALRRTVSGSFDVEDAHTLEALRAMAAEPNALRDAVVPLRRSIPDFPAAFLLPGAEQWLRRGQSVPMALVDLEPGKRLSKGSVVFLCRMNGGAIALARTDPAPLSPPPRALAMHSGPWFQPIKLFETDEPGTDDAE